MPFAIVVGLIGAICWGIAPVFGKLGLENVHPMDGLAARTAITLAFILIWLFATGGMMRLREISGVSWFHLGIEAFLATLAGDLAYYAALKWGSVGMAAVTLSAAPIITISFARIMLGEAMSFVQVAGVVLVTVGIVLVAVGGKQSLAT